MNNKYIYSAAASVFVVIFLYFFKFYCYLGYEISADSAVWGQLGDYVGGILNPILSFVSVVLIVKSLALQNESNKNSEKGEKTRSFESLFFNVIERQNRVFDSFEVSVNNVSCRGAEAVRLIEDQLESISDGAEYKYDAKVFLDDLDDRDALFGLSRSFYLSVKIVSEKLLESQGFSADDRIVQYKLLINFSDFALLRMVMICMRFMDYKSTNYLRSNSEFVGVMNDLGLDYA